MSWHSLPGPSFAEARAVATPPLLAMVELLFLGHKLALLNGATDDERVGGQLKAAVRGTTCAPRRGRPV